MISLQEQIDQIMDEFDFLRVREIMEATDWTWSGQGDEYIPEESELRTVARRHLKAVAFDKDIEVSSSGGFTAEQNDGVLSLFFGVDSFGILDFDE